MLKKNFFEQSIPANKWPNNQGDTFLNMQRDIFVKTISHSLSQKIPEAVPIGHKNHFFKLELSENLNSLKTSNIFLRKRSQIVGREAVISLNIFSKLNFFQNKAVLFGRIFFFHRYWENSQYDKTKKKPKMSLLRLRKRHSLSENLKKKRKLSGEFFSTFLDIKKVSDKSHFTKKSKEPSMLAKCYFCLNL